MRSFSQPPNGSFPQNGGVVPPPSVAFFPTVKKTRVLGEGDQGNTHVLSSFQAMEMPCRSSMLLGPRQMVSEKSSQPRFLVRENPPPKSGERFFDWLSEKKCGGTSVDGKFVVPGKPAIDRKEQEKIRIAFDWHYLERWWCNSHITNVCVLLRRPRPRYQLQVFPCRKVWKLKIPWGTTPKVYIFTSYIYIYTYSQVPNLPSKRELTHPIGN